MKHPTSVLRSAVSRNNIDEVIELLAKPDTDINEKERLFGMTALHYAVVNNNIKMVKILLTHPKIAINAQDTGGDTPLQLAAFSRCLETIKVLTTAGANTNIKNKFGHTPLGIAAINSNFDYKEAIKVLLAHGSDIAKENTRLLSLLNVHDLDTIFRTYLLAAGLKTGTTYIHDINPGNFTRAKDNLIKEVKTLSQGKLKDDEVPKMLRALLLILEGQKATNSQTSQEGSDTSTLAQAFEYLQILHEKKKTNYNVKNVFLHWRFLPPEIVTIIVKYFSQVSIITERCEITTEELYRYYGYVQENYEKWSRFSEIRFTSEFLESLTLTPAELETFRSAHP